MEPPPPPSSSSSSSSPAPRMLKLNSSSSSSSYTSLSHKRHEDNDSHRGHKRSLSESANEGDRGDRREERGEDRGQRYREDNRGTKREDDYNKRQRNYEDNNNSYRERNQYSDNTQTHRRRHSDVGEDRRRQYNNNNNNNNNNTNYNNYNSDRRRRYSDADDYYGNRYNRGYERQPVDETKVDELAQTIHSQYMKGTQIDIPKEKVAEFDKFILPHALSKLISEKQLEFPYKKYFIKDIQQKFKNLSDYRCEPTYDKQYTIPVLSNKTGVLSPPMFDGRYVILPSEKNEYDDMNILSDYFQEDARVRSVAGYNTQSAHDHWIKRDLNIKWINTLLYKRTAIDTYNLREGLYAGVKSEPSTFKATVASTFVRMLKGTRVLDFCAGWGDRLIGALSCQDVLEYYVGVDPNDLLFEGYNNMITQLAPDNANKYTMLCEPFEKCNLPENRKSFDLIFTGPPYFDYEKYGLSGNNQSITSFPTPVQWTVRFLFFCIEKSWALLEEGGHMALNVNDTNILVSRNITFTEVMNLYIMFKLKDAQYKGVISFTGANMALPRPTWIYQKDSAFENSEKSLSRSNEALNSIRTHYFDIYEELEALSKL